jgi:hypothetical protein
MDEREKKRKRRFAIKTNDAKPNANGDSKRFEQS